MKQKSKYIYFIVLAFVFYNLSAQINLKQISFKQKDSITDLELYITSSKKNTENFVSMMSKVSEMFGLDKTKDELRKSFDSIDNTISKKSVEEYEIIYYFEYMDNRVLKRWETKENVKTLTHPIFLDYQKGKEYYHYPSDGEIEFQYIFKKIKNLSIKEEKNQKRKILGINCYKAIATYTEIEEAVNDPEFPEFNIPEEYIEVKLEMWVTKDIKTLYHPVLKVKEILENFYPLEINESNNFIEGSIRKYSLKEIVKM